MSVARTLFPNHKVFERGPCRFEATGLEAGTQPSGCLILQQGETKFGNGTRNTHYLVRVAETLVYIRISTARPESGGAEFAAMELLGEDESTEEFNDRVSAKISALSRPVVPFAGAGEAVRY